MRRFGMNQYDCDNDVCAATQFLKIQKNQINDLQESLERCSIVIPVFAFNSAKYNLNLINFFCYPFLLPNGTFNLLSSRKRTSSSRSNLVIFSYWMQWTIWAEQQAFIHPCRHAKLQKQKGFSPTKSLITLTKCRIQNFSRMTPFTVNFVAVTLLKPNTRTMLTYWKVDWPQNKPLSNWNCQSQPLLELRTVITCNRDGSKNKWAHSKTFCADITNKILCQL